MQKQTYYEKNKTKVLEQQRLKRVEQYKDKIEGEDYVVCEICGHIGANLSTHITNKHKMTTEEYKKQYNKPIKSQKLCDAVKGENNPAYQHGGKFSPFSDKFIHADSIDKDEFYQKVNKTRKENSNDSTTIDYWLKQTDGDLEEAQKLLTERQSTFSLEKCIQKYGEEGGKKRWNERQEKWMKNNKKSNFSKISQELFWAIYNQLEFKEQIKFAELGEKYNNEHVLKLDDITVRPDFIDLIQNKIIEFNGEYWHSEKRMSKSINKTREETRLNALQNYGYKILTIWEQDYKKNKDEIIKKCLDFLKQ